MSSGVAPFPAPRAADQSPARLALITSRFPVVSETFILAEALELERGGSGVELFPLLRERAAVVHPEARLLARRAQHVPLFSRETLAAQAWWLRRRPRAYLGVWAQALAGNVRSPGFLARACFVVPKAAAFALRMQAAAVEHVHAHYATHPALAAWVAARLTGLPYSFTVHAHDLYVNRSMLGRKLAEASFVRTISHHNRELIARLYGPGAAAKTAVVHCGVDLERFHPPPPRSGRIGAPVPNESPRTGRIGASMPNRSPRERRIGAPMPDRSVPLGGGAPSAGSAGAGPPLRLVCVASLQEYKGHRYLLEALARLRREGVETSCRLVGEGELRGELEAQRRRLGLERSVELLGAQPADRVREQLAWADAAVLPSVVTASGKKEGIPVSLMEALAMELPAVATDISGVRELIRPGRTGLLVAERDPEALAAALRRLARDPALRQRLGRAGWELVAREFELRANAARLRELLAAHTPPTTLAPPEPLAR